MSEENQIVRTSPDREYFLDLVVDGVDPKRAAVMAGYSSKYDGKRLVRDNYQALQSRVWEKLASSAPKAVTVLQETMEADSQQTRYLGARDVLDRLGVSAAHQLGMAQATQSHDELRMELERELGPDMVNRIARRAQGLPDDVIEAEPVIEDTEEPDNPEDP